MLKVFRRSLALALALVLVVGLLPLAALADTAESGAPAASEGAAPPDVSTAPDASTFAQEGADEAAPPADPLPGSGPAETDSEALPGGDAPPETDASESPDGEVATADGSRPDQPVAVASAHGLTLSITVESVYSVGSTFTEDVLAVSVRADNAAWTATGPNPGVHAIQYHLSYDAARLIVNTGYGAGGTVTSPTLPAGWDLSCNVSGGSVIVLLTAPNPGTPWPIGNGVIATTYFVVAGSGSDTAPTTLNFGLPAAGRLVSYLENPADPTSRYLAADITNGSFGSIQIKSPLNGWQTIGGATYYFANRVKQKGWQPIDGRQYYFSESTGAMTTGWATVSGANYYFLPSGEGRGAMVTGHMMIDGALHLFSEAGVWLGRAATGWNQLEGYWVFVNDSGTLVTGWLSQGSTWYYLDPGDGGRMADGPIVIAGQLNLFNASGVWLGVSGASGWMATTAGWAYLQNGTALTGWRLIDGSWYYMYPTSGVMAVGETTIGGADYFFASSGAMATGWVPLNGLWYYYGGSGAKTTGWMLAGAWYYMNPAARGAMATGHLTISGADYFFAPSGAMVTGWLAEGSGWYFYDASGAKVTGWLLTGGSWYYMNPANSGLMVTGRFTIGGVVNLFDSSGRWLGEA